MTPLTKTSAGTFVHLPHGLPYIPSWCGDRSVLAIPYLGRSHNSKPSQKQGCSPNIHQITNFPTKSCYHLPTIAWKQPWRMALEHPEKILSGSIGNSNPIKCWGTHDLAHRPKIRGECTNDTRWCVLKIRDFWERCLVPDFSTFEKEMVFVMIFE